MPKKLKLGVPLASHGRDLPQPVSRAACASRCFGSTPSALPASSAQGHSFCTNSSGEPACHCFEALASALPASIFEMKLDVASRADSDVVPSRVEDTPFSSPFAAPDGVESEAEGVAWNALCAPRAGSVRKSRFIPAPAEPPIG